MKKTLFLKLPMTLVVLLSAAIFTSIYYPIQSGNAKLDKQDVLRLGVPIAISGNNVYTAWPNNDTGHWGVFFAKSTDSGKTLGKTITLSAPNKGNVVDLNVQIAASGSNVFVTWWTNKTGMFMPVFKTSNNDGNTFEPTLMLNSTSTP